MTHLHCHVFSLANFCWLAPTTALRLNKFINHYPVTIQNYSGSTHNMVQPRLATTLTLPVQKYLISCLIGNRELLLCIRLCLSVCMKVHTTPFTILLSFLRFTGFAIIFRFDWPCSLGPVTSIHSFSFQHNNIIISLQGVVFPCRTPTATVSNLKNKVHCRGQGIDTNPLVL
ncbi:hypothetical protein Hanom_Chr15g01394741 [Helianthus anomalus]